MLAHMMESVPKDKNKKPGSTTKYLVYLVVTDLWTIRVNLMMSKQIRHIIDPKIHTEMKASNLDFVSLDNTKPTLMEVGFSSNR